MASEDRRPLRVREIGSRRQSFAPPPAWPLQDKKTAEGAKADHHADLPEGLGAMTSRFAPPCHYLPFQTTQGSLRAKGSPELLCDRKELSLVTRRVLPWLSHHRWRAAAHSGPHCALFKLPALESSPLSGCPPFARARGPLGGVCAHVPKTLLSTVLFQRSCRG